MAKEGITARSRDLERVDDVDFHQARAGLVEPDDVLRADVVGSVRVC